MFHRILEQFGINASAYQIDGFGSGLINRTWKISGDKSFILQRINTRVFTQPETIAENLFLLQSYLKERYPGYLFVAPIPALNGQPLVYDDEGTFRLFPFIEGSISVNEVQDYKQAYAAAGQFGKFSFLLKDFDPTLLKDTLPDFHDLALRYNQFEHSYQQAGADRLQQADGAIAAVKKYTGIVTTYIELTRSGMLPLRVVHHDAKINNVLFDSEWNALCLVDLDTVMAGYFISDVGDMLRTYLCAANEEETDLSKIVINEALFTAIYNGYLAEMGNELTSVEKDYFIYSGKFMIYMQALRFLTDFLNGDVYYYTTYPDQNLNRAKNQLALLEQLVNLEQKTKLLTN